MAIKKKMGCYVCDHLKPEFQGGGTIYRLNYTLETVNFHGTVHEDVWVIVMGSALYCPGCGRLLSDGKK